jgi:hypothetical protein
MNHRERAKRLIDSKWVDMPTRLAMEVYIAEALAAIERETLERAAQIARDEKEMRLRLYQEQNAAGHDFESNRSRAYGALAVEEAIQRSIQDNKELARDMSRETEGRPTDEVPGFQASGSSNAEGVKALDPGVNASAEMSQPSAVSSSSKAYDVKACVHEAWKHYSDLVEGKASLGPLGHALNGALQGVNGETYSQKDAGPASQGSQSRGAGRSVGVGDFTPPIPGPSPLDSTQTAEQMAEQYADDLKAGPHESMNIWYARKAAFLMGWVKAAKAPAALSPEHILRGALQRIRDNPLDEIRQWVRQIAVEALTDATLCSRPACEGDKNG